MPLPRVNIAASPVALAFAIGSAFTCLALWSGHVPPARPKIAEQKPHPVRRVHHVRRVAYRPEPIVTAADVLSGAGTATAQDTVRVLLTKAVQNGKVSLRADADLLVINPETHAAVGRVPAGKTYTISLSADGRALAGPGGGDLPCDTMRILSLNASRPISIGSRAYLGAIEVRLGDAGIEVINEVRREDYIAGVLAGESVKSFPLGALKAQAVAARTFAMAQLGHRPGGIDVVDTVADQVYRGVPTDWPEVRQAVEETAGIIATYKDEPIVAYFSADCGGCTRTNGAAGLGGGDLPYLRPVVDAPAGGADYCSASPKHTWTLTLTDADILPKLAAKTGRKMASISDIRFTRVYSDGRVGEVEIEGLPKAPPTKPAPETPSAAETAPEAGKGDSPVEPPVPEPPVLEPVKVSLPGFEFRRCVGTNILKSQIMTVTRAGNGSWAFSGRGYGHGVGLCQWGACGMARAGIAFDAILKHYYTGIDLTHQKTRTGTLEGVARDLSGALAPGATVRLAGTNLQTVAGPDGRFRFEGVPVGAYDVVTTPVKGDASVSFAWRVEE